jgi:hypothetical protein
MILLFWSLSIRSDGLTIKFSDRNSHLLVFIRLFTFSEIGVVY